MSRHSDHFSLKLLLAFVMVLIVGLTESFACSIQVDHNAQKNELISHAVSHADLSLAAVSGIAITNYDQNFEDEGPLGSCPNYQVLTARVSFNHIKSVVESCSYAMTVTVRNYMGEEFPEGPIQEITISESEAACSISQLRVPRKIKLKKKIIVRFPFPH